MPAGKISNPALIFRDLVLTIETEFEGEDIGPVGAVDMELVEEVGVCRDVFEQLPLVLEGTFTSILACVLSVHAEGGSFVVGRVSMKARKGTGVGASILWTLRASCLPRFVVPVRVGHDKVRDAESSLSSLSDVNDVR